MQLLGYYYRNKTPLFIIITIPTGAMRVCRQELVILILSKS